MTCNKEYEFRAHFRTSLPVVVIIIEHTYVKMYECGKSRCFPGTKETFPSTSVCIIKLAKKIVIFSGILLIDIPNSKIKGKLSRRKRRVLSVKRRFTYVCIICCV